MKRLSGVRRVAMWPLVSIGYPLLPVAVAVGAAAISATPPPFLDNWVGSVLSILITLGAFLLIFGNVSVHDGCLVGILVFLALSTATFQARTAYEAWVLQDRGAVTACTILKVNTRTVYSTTTHADGTSSSSSTTYYDHTLRCAAPSITTMTTTHATAGKGASIQVAYDPTGRLSPRPTSDADLRSSLRWALVGLTLTILLNLATASGLTDRIRASAHSFRTRGR
ncbi:hypothetical protein [Nonomuraea sediminis]|uniref:hypothetical protein n=1 Tax=Nonomuraea sediminis TaxID=2835864 RepID=UPI001BDCA312|nr:hypothetical protein [Nonomuraea sediminis]